MRRRKITVLISVYSAWMSINRMPLCLPCDDLHVFRGFFLYDFMRLAEHGHPEDHPPEDPEFHADDGERDPDLHPGGVVADGFIPLEPDDGDVEPVQDDPRGGEERGELDELGAALPDRLEEEGGRKEDEPDDFEQVPVPHRGVEVVTLLVVHEVDELEEDVGEEGADGPLAQAEEDAVVSRVEVMTDAVLEGLLGEEALDHDHGEPREDARHEEHDRDVARIPQGVDLRGGQEEERSQAGLVQGGEGDPEDDGAGGEPLQDPSRLRPVQPLRDDRGELQELAD